MRFLVLKTKELLPTKFKLLNVAREHCITTQAMTNAYVQNKLFCKKYENVSYTVTVLQICIRHKLYLQIYLIKSSIMTLREIYL